MPRVWSDADDGVDGQGGGFGKADKRGRQELWDLRTPGLCLRVTARGVKTWIFRYRTPEGRQPRFTIGNFPSVGLKDARVRAAELDREVALGGDPDKARRDARVEVKERPRTFGELSAAYLAACESGEWKPKGKKKDTVILREKARVKLHVEPSLGRLPLEAIGGPHVKAFLKGMRQKGIGAQTKGSHWNGEVRIGPASSDLAYFR